MVNIKTALLQLLPRNIRSRLAYKLLRTLYSEPEACRAIIGELRVYYSEARAYADLFVKPYCNQVDWKSGLGEGIHVLYGLARALRPEVIVEIGSARGRSTCTLALACQQNKRGMVYAIDPHSVNPWTEYWTNGHTLAFLRERIQDYGLEPWCTIIHATSSQAHEGWNKPIDLLFIDGDHSYEGIKKDFELFAPHLKKNALVVFHDSLWEYLKENPEYGKYYRDDMGVPAFMKELQQEGYHSVTLSCFPGMTVLCPRVGGFNFFPPTDEAAGMVIMP